MEYLNVEEVVKALKISKPSLYRMTSQKLIPFIKLGQRILFEPEEIRKWVEGKRVNVGVDHV